MTSRAVDPRSELVFDIHELGRRAGGLKQIDTVVPAPQGLGNAMIGVPTDSPIDLELRLESVVEGVLATGVAGLQLRGQCARCLAEIEAEAEIDIQELFYWPGREPDDEEVCRVEGDHVDLEPVLRDAAVLDLPFIPLCREDCAGLCPDCGANLNDDPGHTHDESTDPRWAGLVDWADGDRTDAAPGPTSKE